MFSTPLAISETHAPALIALMKRGLASSFLVFFPLRCGNAAQKSSKCLERSLGDKDTLVSWFMDG